MSHLVQSLTFIALISSSACAQKPSSPTTQDMQQMDMEKPGLEIATLGGGCFWCVEAVYQDLKGVYKVESGYSGGHVDNPGYREVSSGSTGHAEVVQVHFDPSEITFPEILEVFWRDRKSVV